MRRLVWATIVLLVGSAASASTAVGVGTRVRVTPARGGIHTNFVLRFSIPGATGVIDGVSDSVSVVGHHRPGCVGAVEIPLRPAPAGTAFRLKLDPARRHAHWCAGRFTGALVQQRTTVCPGPQLIICPLFVLAPRVLASFRFTVTAPKHTIAAH